MHVYEKMHSINVSCLVFHDHSIFISTEAVEGSPGWEGIPAPAVQDIPEEAEQLRTGEEEPRTAADSKPAGDMPGCLEVGGAGRCCKGCSRPAGECTAGRAEASWAALGRAEAQGLRRTGWPGGWPEPEPDQGEPSCQHWEEEGGLEGQTSGAAGRARGGPGPGAGGPGPGWRGRRRGPSTAPPSPSSGRNRNQRLCSEIELALNYCPLNITQENNFVK